MRWPLVARWAAVIAVLACPSIAEAQCSGQVASGAICANPTGSQAPVKGASVTSIFDILYGSAAGSIIYRGPSGWTSLAGNTSGTKVLSETSSGVPSWQSAAGTGTVTSVGLSLPGIFSVSGSPVTNSGTLTATLASESANLVFASPDASPGTPTFRTLVLGDFPAIGSNTVVGNATSGSAVPTALALPSCSSATSALIWTSNTGFGCNSITGTGSVTNIATGAGLTGGPITTTGTISLASIAADNVLANSTGGSAAPIATALGSCSAAQNALTYNTSTHAFGCNTISGSGTVVVGTAGQMAWYSGTTNVVGGNPNANISAGALTLGTASTTLGQLILEGSSSGSVTLTPQAAAGTPTITFGTASGTPVVTASAPLAITTSTGNITITGAAGTVLAGASPAFTATPTIGLVSSATGQLKIAGTTSGTLTLTVNDAAGTWTMKLPTSGGSAGQFLSTDGTGVASWADATGSGTVSSGTAGQLTYYGSSGTTVSGNSNANIASGALTLGQTGSTIGKLILAGNTSGAVTVAPQAAAGTFNFNLPITAGAAGAILTSGGGGAAPMAWLADVATGQVLMSGGVGVIPAFSATLPAAVQGNITTVGALSSGSLAAGFTPVTGSLIATNTVANSNLAQMTARSVKCNNVNSTQNAADCTSVVLGPTASSLNQGLIVVQSGAGTTGGIQALYNEISLTDNADTGNNVASSYALAWYVNQNFGGTSTTGGREANFSNLLQTAPARSMVTSAPFLTTNGSGYGNTATGTLTWSGSGCSTNPALNVTTNSGGGIVTINSITTTGICMTPPSPAATTWTASAGLSAGSGVSLSVTTIAVVGTGYGNTATGTLTWAGAGCSVNPVLNVTTNAGGGVITINSVTTPGTCTVFPISSATTWTAGGGLSAGSGVAFNLTNGNSVRFYVAVSGQAQSVATDGGTIGSNREQGKLYGSNFIGVLSSGATGYEQVSAAYDQVWVQAGASVKRKAIHQFLYGGIQGGGGAGDTVQGSTTDAALLISAEPGATAGGLNGILFTDVAGANPMASASTLIKIETSTTATIDTGIDLSQATITTNFLKSKSYTVSGAGVTTINQNTSSLPSVSAGNLFQLGGADGANTPMTFDAFGGAPVLIVRRADGTNASKTAIQAGDALFQFGGQGYDGAAYSGSQVALNFLAGANWSGSSHPTVIAFAVTPLSSTSAATALQINPDGSVNALGITDATTTSTGIVTVAGGMGVAKNIIGGAGVQTGTKTVSGLPACNSTTKAMKYFVTDATATTFHSTVAGSGANNVGVTCDGTNWYIS